VKEVIKSVLNRGAPIDTPIMFNVKEFLEIFENEALYTDYRKNVVGIISKLSNIMDFFGGTTILPVLASISMDENNSKVLQYPGENLFYNISEILYDVDVDEVIEACEQLDKFRELKKKILEIKTPEELKRLMPRLYDLYSDQVATNKNLLDLEELMNDSNAPLDLKMRNYSRITRDLSELYSNFDLKREQQFAKDFTLELYLERLLQGIENLLANFEKVIEIYEDASLELESFLEEDLDKLNLYIAAQFMDTIENIEPEEQQRYLFYLTNYFRDNVETQVTRVKIKLNGHKVTPISLYERYKKIMVKNPELLAVNFTPADFRDMSKEEVEEFIVAYLSELSANWELLPSEDESIEKTIRNIAKREHRELSLEESKQKEEKLVNLYMQKKRFYDSTDPYFRIKGKNTFDGYVGYIYSNSIVVLEKFYANVEEKKIAENHAIYIMSMKDFYELSQHSRSYLIANHLCKRVIHKGSWQVKVLKYINKTATGETPAEDTKKLIKDEKITLKEKKL